MRPDCKRRKDFWRCEDHYHCDICVKPYDPDVDGDIPEMVGLCAECAIAQVIENCKRPIEDKLVTDLLNFIENRTHAAWTSADTRLKNSLIKRAKKRLNVGSTTTGS